MTTAPAARRSRLSRLGAKVVVAVAAISAVVAVAGLPVYVFPRQEQVRPGDPVDAILALGGDEQTAIQAYALAVSGGSDVVVVSNPYDTGFLHFVDRVCSDPPRDGPEIICFVPDPSTTRGEARGLRDLAASRGWDSVAVTTTTPHITRARYIVGRCYSGELRMVDVNTWRTPWDWVYAYAYQTAGFVKAFGQRGC